MIIPSQRRLPETLPHQHIARHEKQSGKKRENKLVRLLKFARKRT